MFILLFFLFGTAIGSFLNVLIDRLPNDESVVKGRSYCDHCKKQILWYDLVPLLSFIFLRGKCRHCRSPISYYYPVVELVTGVMFVLTYLILFGDLRFTIYDLRFFVTFGYYLFILSGLIVIFFADLKYGIIPDKIVFPAILVSIAYLFINNQSLIINHLLVGLVAFLFFLLLYLVTKGRGMGFGDVKLVLLLGLFLGFPKAIVAFYIAFLTGAVIGCILILWKKKKFSGGTIPFGPFLVLGAIISFFWGEYIFLKAMQALRWWSF